MAIEALMAAYRCFGDRITNDLRKARPKRINQILERFEDIVCGSLLIADNPLTPPPDPRAGNNTKCTGQGLCDFNPLTPSVPILGTCFQFTITPLFLI